MAPMKTLGQNAPERVFYLSGVHTLNGHLYKPSGKGPFPTVVFNQAGLNGANTGQVKPYATLAQMFTSKGWAFFVPGRHTLGPTNEKVEKTDAGESLLREHEKQAANISAAISWLKGENYVDTRRIVIFAEAAGAVSSLLVGEKDLGLSAMILFSPGTQALKVPSVQERMKHAAQYGKAPMFIIQANNDVNLLPVDILGLELEKRGGMDRFKVYPAYGASQSQVAKFPTEGYSIWQTDVFGFIGEVLESKTMAGRATN